VLTLGIVFGVLVAVVVALITVLLRRSATPTENADGLLIEQQRRAQAHADRQAYHTNAVHGRPPTFRDDRHRR
jgi:MFS superfamily sulfate permease-like transporter